MIFCYIFTASTANENTNKSSSQTFSASHSSRVCFVQSNGSKISNKFCHCLLLCLHQTHVSNGRGVCPPLVIAIEHASYDIKTKDPYSNQIQRASMGSPRKPFMLVSMSLFASCWLHSFSASYYHLNQQ
ncbi:hypothetical protein ACOSP7_022494 [Xanthoceras sorbifolium]